MAEKLSKNKAVLVSERYRRLALETLDELLQSSMARRDTGTVRVEVEIKDGFINLRPKSHVTRLHEMKNTD